MSSPTSTPPTRDEEAAGRVGALGDAVEPATAVMPAVTPIAPLTPADSGWTPVATEAAIDLRHEVRGGAVSRAPAEAAEAGDTIEELLALLEEELRVRAVASPEPDPASGPTELALHAATIALAVRDDAARAARLLAEADEPATLGLRFDLALAGAVAIEPVAAAARRAGDRLTLAALGAQLLGAGERPRAIAVLRDAGDEGREELALALAGEGHFAEWAALFAPVATTTSETDAIEDALEAAHLFEDRLGDAAAARAELAKVARLADAERPGGPALIERAIEHDVDGAEMLRRKIDTLAAEPAAFAERSAAQYLLAARLGATIESASLLAALCASEPEFGGPLALAARARVEAALGDPRAAASALLARAERAAVPAWASAFRRRAAELLDARAADAPAAEALRSSLQAGDPASLGSARALARLRLARGDREGVAAAWTAFGRARLARDRSDRAGVAALARAAHAVEADARRPEPVVPDPGGDARALAARGAARWREALAAATAAGADDLAQQCFGGLARALRRAGDPTALAAVHAARATSLPAADSGAALHAAVAMAVTLDVRGAVPETALAAIAAATPALDAAPALVPALVHATFARAGGDHAAEARALAAALAHARGDGLRVRLLVRLAGLRLGPLGDAASAGDAIEAALSLCPAHPDALAAHARLACAEARFADAAIALEQAAAAAASEPSGHARAAALLVEAGRLGEERLGDDASAADAYRRAHAQDPASREALGALAALHRRLGEARELREVLAQLSALEGDAGARVSLQAELAEAALASGEVEAAAAAWRDAIRLAPDSTAGTAAIEGLLALARRESRFDLLAAAFEGTPPRGLRSPAALAALAEAFERLGRTKELLAVRERELQLAVERDDRAGVLSAARALAATCERVGDLDGALRALHRVDELDEGDAGAARALQSIYAERGRYADLAAAIERELHRLAPAPGRASGEATTRARALWLRLGAIRKDQLGRPEAAAAAFEAALALDAHDPAALAALADVYATLGRTADLVRVLATRAETATDPAERLAARLRLGEEHERAADEPGALASFRAAFELDPTSRAAFAGYERACYRTARWADAIALYERAIRLVEVEGRRAYRLADLYARRGQVESTWLADAAAASVSFARALDLDPESDPAQAALERVLVARGAHAELLEAYERREAKLSDDARRAEVLRRAARLARDELRDPARAIALYARLHAADPTDAEAIDALERHAEETRDHARLLDVLRTRTALTTSGDEAIALYLRIATLCEEGLSDIDQAIEAYKRILDVAPSHQEALAALARLYEGTGRWAELVDVSRRQTRVVADRGHKALIYFRCGSVMESKFGQDDEAIRYYEAAIRTSATCLPAVHGLRDLFLRRQDFPRVIQTLELEARLWSDEKERAGVLSHLGRIHQQLGDAAQAIKHYERALAVDPECGPANRALFELYFGRGEFARALPLGAALRDKAARDGAPAERSELQRKLAVVARETGDARGAAAALLLALQAQPENLDALELLVDLGRAHPDVHDFEGTLAQLARIYRARAGAESPGTSPARLLARVLVGQATLAERALEVDAAEVMLEDAQRLAPDDMAVIDAQVGLWLRLRKNDVAALALERFAAKAKEPAARRDARLRLAEVYGDASMEPERAIAVLTALLAEQPQLEEARFRLSQELFVVGRLDEAEAACERLIAIAAAPGQTAPPERLARYYDYRGRVAEARGDAPAASRNYRRAVDLDPVYPPPVLALARRLAAAGDVSSAIALVERAIAPDPRGTVAVPGPSALGELTRGLARLHASFGDRRRAIALLEQAAAQGEARALATDDDHLLAAELRLREGDIEGARREADLVLQRDVRSASAHRVMVRLYDRARLHGRSARVASVLRLLGYPDSEGTTLRPFVSEARRGSLPDDARRTKLTHEAANGAWAEAFERLREPLEERFPPPPLARFPDLAPPKDEPLRAAIADVQRLFQVEADVRLATSVPGGVLTLGGAHPVVVVEGSLAERPGGERRFLLGRAFEPLRSGTSLLFRLGPAELLEVGRLASALLVDGGAAPERPFEAWLAGVAKSADRGGLLACDDVGAAARVLARLGGEELAVTEEGAVLFGQVPGTEELLRFFLSDDYEALRAAVEA